MPLPSAVKRNADKARKAVAESNGAKAPAPPLQQSDGEFLSVGATIPSANTEAVIAPVSPQALADQKAKLDSERHVQQRDEGTRIPHALSSERAPEQGIPESSSPKVDTAAPSPVDPVNAGTPDNNLPDFIDLDDWKGRYNALRSIRDTRSETLEQENRTLKSQNSELQARVKEREPETPAAKRFELDDDMRANLGEEQSQVIDQLSKSVEDRFAKAEHEQHERQKRDADRFEANLGSQVPRWREINVDPKFLSWLNQTDEVVGLRRQVMLDSFVRDFDATSVAALFRSFAASSGGGQQRIGQEDPSPEVPSSRAGSGLGAEEQMVEVWDQSEIADFYHAKNRLYQSGKLKGAKLDQVMAEEAKIRKAMDEGRVNMSA